MGSCAPGAAGEDAHRTAGGTPALLFWRYVGLYRTGDFRGFVGCGFGAAFDHSHGVEDCVDYRFISYCCVDHDVVEGAGGPVGVEVVFDVGDALTVDGIDEILGRRLGAALLPDAADFFGARSVKKYVEGIGLLAQEERRAAADYDSIPFLAILGAICSIIFTMRSASKT